MDFDWTKPLLIDWTGRSGPLISEEDIKSSVIHRILRNQFQAPFCGREIARATPWWSPRDPFGTTSENSLTGKRKRFIPGLHHPPAYPQLSTLSRQQHQQGLRVLAAAHDVQPRDYPYPTQKDYQLFEEIKELYEKEQKEYIKWAKQTWINGDCIRALRPKPTIEQVYEAEFKMRAYEAQSLPQNYTLAAQIPLETKTQAFEFEHKQDLINVDVEDLPNVEYPEEMNSDFSILKPCPLPEPCAEHPCKFVLPYESSVSNQPLSETNYELAQYAIGNGVSFVASENALHCLLETERSWCIPVSVVELVGPDGDVRNVTVLGSEFGAQKECASQRTYKAYKHLLRHRFAPSTGHYKMKTSTQQTAKSSSPSFIEEPIAQRLNRYGSLDDDLAVSSDDDNRLQIDDYDDPKIYESDGDINECDGEPSSEPDRLMIDDNDVNITELYYNQDSYKTKCSKNTEGRPSYSYNESTNEADRLLIDENDVHTEQNFQDIFEPDYSNDSEARPSYSSDARCSEPHQDMIDNIIVNNQVPFYNKDSYEPDYSNDFQIRPSYSRSEPISQPDRLLIDDSNVTNQVPVYSKGSYEPEYSNDLKVTPSYERSSEPDRLPINILYENTTDTNPNYTKTDTSQPNIRLLEANEVAAPSLFETKEDAAPCLFEVNKDTDPRFFEMNENGAPSSFEINEDANPGLFEINKDTDPKLFEANKLAEPRLLETSKATDPIFFDTIKDASTSLFKTNEDVAICSFETNKDAVTNLFETNKDAVTNLFETNKDAATNSFETNEDAATNSFETNKDAATNSCETNKDAATNSFETNKDAATNSFETNKDAATNSFETNKDAVTNFFETNKAAEPRLFEMNEDYNPRLFNMSEDYDPRYFYMNEEAASRFFETNINEPTTQTKTRALPKFNSNEPVTSEDSSQNNSILSPNQLSPIKQSITIANSSKATVSVQQLNFESCPGKHNVSVNNTEIINDHVEEISEVSIKIPLKTFARSKRKKRSISGASNVFDQANQKLSTSRNDAKCHVEVIEPITTQKTSVTLTQLIPLKPCIKKPETSPRKNSPRKLCFSESITSGLTYETDANSNQANKSEINRSDVDKPRNVRNRRPSGLIYDEHGYCIKQSENPRTIEKQSGTSYEGSNSSRLSPVKLTVDHIIEKSNYVKTKEPGVSRLSFNAATPTTHETKIEINDTSTNRKQDIEDLGTNNSTKTNRGKISIKELFGDESDSDEPIYSIAKRCITFNKANCDNHREESIKDVDSNKDFIEPSTKNASYIDPVSDKLSSIEKSPLKTILRKPSFSDSSPKNSKRKLSFSDPLTGDPEFMSFGEPDSEGAIVGFVNGVAVPLTQPKNNQKVIYTYSIPSRSRPKVKPATAAKKPKTTKAIKENSGFTKITLSKPNKQNKYLESSNIGKTKQLTETKNVSQRKSRSISARSYNDSDDSDSCRYSRRISAVSNIGKPNMTHKQTETVKVGLKRSRLISSRSYSDESDAPDFSQRSPISKVTKENAPEDSDDSRINKTKINNNDGLRRSSSLSTHSTKENAPEDSDDSRINKTKINNTDGLRRSPRLSTHSTKENTPKDSDHSQINKTKINKTNGLRRSRRLSTHSTKENAPEDSDDLQINKTKINNSDGLRRSSSLSTHSTKENAPEDSDDLQINKTKIDNNDGLRRSSSLLTHSTKENAPEDSDDSRINKTKINNIDGLRRSPRLSTHSTKENAPEDSDDLQMNKTKINNSDGLRRSSSLSTHSAKENAPEDSDDLQINKTKINNNDGLRRSSSLSTHSTKENAPEDSDDLQINKTKINNSDGLRRSPRLSTHSTKVNTPEDSDHSRINKTKINKTDGLRRPRRLSTRSTKENAPEDSDDLQINKTKISNSDGLRRSPRLSTHSTKENTPEDSDDSRLNKTKINNADGLRRSRRLSTYLTKEKADSNHSRINKTKINKTDRLRRSRRLSTRSTKENAPEHSDDSRINKTMINNNDGLRRSRCLSTRSTKENVPPKTNQKKPNEHSLSLNTANTIKKRENRRKSLPANIFSNTDKLNKVIRSKSVTNLYEIVKVKKILRSGSKIVSNSTKSLNTRDMDRSLELSERTKRFLRRTFNLVSSESDQSEGEMSERTKRYTCRSIPSVYSEAEKSDTELKKRSKKYTRRTNFTSSYYERNSKNSKTESTHGDTAERTKRDVSRSISSAYSSYEETDQPMPIRRKGTKRQPKNINTQVDQITNTMDSSSAMETNQINQSNTIRFKTEVMYTAENQVESTIHNMEQSLDENKMETHEIEIKLYEVPNENIDETETCEDNSLLTEEELFGYRQNTGNEIEEFNIFHFTASTEMDVSGTESSDSENEMYICHSNTLDTLNSLTKNAINETKDMESVKTEMEDKSHTTEENRPRTEDVFFESANDPLTSNALSIESDDGMEDKDQMISNKVNQPVEPILTDPDETIRSRKLSISETSDSSDYYFDTNDTEELNMFHFTATNNTDSEEESNGTSKDLDSSVASRTEEEKLKTINRTETNTLNKTDNVKKLISQNVKDSFPSSSSSGDRISNYETLDMSALSKESINDIIGMHNCTCKGTLFEVPPPRSFKKWQLRNITSNVNFNIIVHSSHKVRQGTRELLLEPIVEYQPELGGAKQSAGKLRALALSLMMRQSAGLINVRIDHDNGNVILVDRMSSKQFVERHGDRRGDVADCLHTAINQLRCLMPGQYVLTHDSRHGANAMLYTTKGVHCAGAGAPHTLTLRQDSINMPDADEAIHAKIPPELGPALLPYHKYRSTLPLAFTPFKSQVREERRAGAALPKASHPPSAIQWPKKKKTKKIGQRQSASLAPTWRRRRPDSLA